MATRTEASKAVQDYAKAIWSLGTRSHEPVSTSAIAERLEVSPASASAMVKRLESMGLVKREPYHGVQLSPAGERVALEVIRHHRLIETYLAEALGVPWDEVHAEAEVLEHVLSEQLEARISERLGHPSADPHGHPIPSSELEMPEVSARRLWDVRAGLVMVERVSDAHPGSLRYLADLGVKPGVAVEVVGRGPLGGPLFVRVEKQGHALSREVAEAIWVA